MVWWRYKIPAVPAVSPVGGAVDVSQATGKIKVTSVSGDMQLQRDTSVIIVDSVSGEVSLQVGYFDRLTASTVSGDQEIEGHLGK